MWNRLGQTMRWAIRGTALVAAGVVAWGPLQASCARSMLSAAREGNVDAFHHGIPPLSRSAAAVFASGLKDEDARVRSAAADGLCMLEGLSKAYVPELLSVAAGDTDEPVRDSAISALGCI